jgi:methylenetetrahydrofolate dehydrogenase (NADP+)/methenyltetrahydrofolate cyclohydrolase
MTIIDGKKTSQDIKDEVRDEVAKLKKGGVEPTLAVILVGENPASQVYVRNKKRACEYTGIRSLSYELPENTTEEELLKLIDELNNRSDCDGILVQLPLPKHIDEKKITNAISPKKDVDGFHPVNVGNMLIGDECFLPCTPHGIIELLHRYGVVLDGKKAVVVGRSNIVGKPMAMLLLRENATVTICHSHTSDLKKECTEADILIAAIGKPEFFTPEYIKNGAAVIDVGMDRDENGKLCGDVDFEAVKDKCSFITPVPGGVGPMTIAMLMQNTLISSSHRMR